MKRHYRTLFISDVHLGFDGCRARDLSALLKRVTCDKLYLVGDIIDMWRLRSRWYWPTAHNDVVRRILKFAKHGTEVIFIPGNHDEAARPYVDLEFGGVRIKRFDVHHTADGRKLLVTHGDQYDFLVKHSRLLCWFGDVANDWLIELNRIYNGIRLAFGASYWSLSQYLKQKVKTACQFVKHFEDALLHEAQRQGLDGVVCGHIHKAGVRQGPVDYFNCGDWIESCTLLAESHDGSIELIHGVEFVAEVRQAILADGRRLRAVS